MDPLVIVSPHLDDAVLSCGQLMAGRPDVVVVTVFAGVPSSPRLSTSFDRQSGWQGARAAVIGRRHEDRQACDVLAARPVWLSFPDSQYGEHVDVYDVASSIAAAVVESGARVAVGPVGLAHPDHLLVARAWNIAARRIVDAGAESAWVYEELPARVLWPEQVVDALGQWRARHWEPRLGFLGTGPRDVKRQAIACYRSQLWAPELDDANLHVPERLWRLWPAD